jgi:hypothetical protein
MEKDLNSLNEATVRSNLKDKIFKEQYDALLNSQALKLLKNLLILKLELLIKLLVNCKKLMHFIL